jgi:predicted metal-dependent hydrolase
MPDLRYGQQKTSYKVVRSARRTLAVTVSPEGVVLVRAPYHTSEQRVAEFAEGLKPWIFRHLARYEQQGSGRRFVSGESLLYLGKKYMLRVVEGDTEDSGVVLTASRLRVTVNPDMTEEAKKEAVAAALKDWYRVQAETVLPERLRRISSLMGASPAGVKIKTQLRRWGSCSVKGVIALNWQLVMAPIEVIDYVIVHELCHLKIPNHQRRFWEYVAGYAPEYKKMRKWLRLNGHAITFLP